MLVPVFADAVTVTVPPPDTVDGVVSQLRLSLTDQLQPLRPDTVTVPEPPPEARLTDVGETPDGDDGHGAGCDTVTLRPPTVTVPVRVLVPVFADAVTVTVPPPDTVDGVVVSQVRSSLTDQLQSLRPDTVTLPEAPPAARLTDVGDTPDGDEGQGTPVCTTVTLRLPTLTVPIRAPASFAVTLIVTDSPADTLDGPAVIQLWSSLTLTGTSRHGASDGAATTCTLADPAPLPNCTSAGVTPGSGQGGGV